MIIPWHKVNKTGTCWLWTGKPDRSGYGRYAGYLAHRYVWLAHGHEIPAGLELDHLCRVRHCVNPDHLEAVTHAENVRRGNGGRKPAITCPAGHEYLGVNVYVRPDGRGRGCAECRRSWQRKNRASKRT